MNKKMNINLLISKQLKLIDKKEDKLLKESNNNYIESKLSPIKEKIRRENSPKASRNIRISI